MRHYLYSLNPDQVDTKTLTPLEKLEQLERKALVDGFLTSLPSPTREIMEFYYSNGSEATTVSDLARRLCMSRQNANQHHLKGKRQGRSCQQLDEIA